MSWFKFASEYVSGWPGSWHLSFSVGFVGVRFVTDGSLHFPVCSVGYLSLEGSSSGPLVARLPLGLCVLPKFLILDPFFEVISFGKLFLFS